MRKHIFAAIILSCFTLCSTLSHAQILPSLGCNDKNIRLQSEQIKQDFKAQGLEIFKDAMINMESRQPTPIAVHLKKGILYQMVFIGSKEANRLNFEVYDGEDKKIDERILKNPAMTNFVIYSFVPEKTDLYLVILSQVKGTKNLCGSFSIMQPAAGNRPAAKPTAPINNNTKTPAKTQSSNPRYVPQKGK
ncbi:hypothetical protein CAP35_08685 [Chitinophagaceae bacterium IBVUCB1]|nr:hypothetical protein CAP35_08685 [Chitinophagaceae bacterium IBVUCB1]